MATLLDMALLLVNRHGEKLLRVKGIIAVEGHSTPVVIHGVQHLIHKPVHLPNGQMALKGACSSLSQTVTSVISPGHSRLLSRQHGCRFRDFIKPFAFITGPRLLKYRDARPNCRRFVDMIDRW